MFLPRRKSFPVCLPGSPWESVRVEHSNVDVVPEFLPVLCQRPLLVHWMAWNPRNKWQNGDKVRTLRNKTPTSDDTAWKWQPSGRGLYYELTAHPPSHRPVADKQSPATRSGLGHHSSVAIASLHYYYGRINLVVLILYYRRHPTTATLVMEPAISKQKHHQHQLVRMCKLAINSRFIAQYSKCATDYNLLAN